jgi:hypothetical protein
MARVSSASTEAGSAPGMIPFDWEAAPGRPGRKSIKSGFSGNTAAAERDAAEAPSLPLPPGRRPKDGFNLPCSQPGESPDLQSEVKLEPGRTSSQPRKLFNLKFPGSPKKPPFTSRMRLPFQSSSKPPKHSHVDEDNNFSIFNPISGHRFGSSVTRRMLEQLTKKESSWRRCLSSKPESEDPRKASSSHIDQSKGRRLDSVDEGYITANDSPASGPSLPSSPGHGFPSWSDSSPVVTKHIQPSSPGHGHRHSSNTSPVATKQLLQPSSPGYGSRHPSNSSPVATKQLLQPSSPVHGHSSNSSPVVTKQIQGTSSARFMASMLISLCPEADDCDEQHFDAVDEITNNYNDDNRSSSPEAIFETPAKPSECSEIVVDPASQTLLSHEECRCTCKHRAHISARVDFSSPQVNQRKKMSKSVSRNLDEELATARSPFEHLRSENTVADQKDIADAYPVFFEASSNRELMRRREPYQSSLSRKPCTEKSQPNEEPVADTAQEPGDSEFAKEIFEVVAEEKYERRGGNRSLARDFSPGSNSSSSSESYSRHNTVWSRPNPSNLSFSKDVNVPMSKSKCGAPLSMVGYLSPPRTSSGDSEYSSNGDKPKALARWKSTSVPSILRKSACEGRSERNQLPATRVNFLSPPRKQASQQQSAAPSEIRIKDRKQTLKPSSQRRLPPKALHALRNDDTDDSDEDYERSTYSSPHTTPRAVLSPPNFASPKPASLVLPEHLLKSPSLLKFKLQRQLSHRESLPLPQAVDRETAVPGPSFNQVLLARSHSVRSSSSRVFTPQECHAMSSNTHLRGPEPPSPASRLAKTSSSVMSKVAEWEAKAGVGHSGKSAPLYRFS